MSNSNEHLQAAMKSVEGDIADLKAQHTYLHNTIDSLLERMSRYNREADKIEASIVKLEKLYVSMREVYRDIRQAEVHDYALQDIPTDELLKDDIEDEDEDEDTSLPRLPSLTANTAVAKLINNG